MIFLEVYKVWREKGVRGLVSRLQTKNYKLQTTSGQVMILTVLAMGGAILGATTIAGLLMLYQIRQTTDLANSGKAIYAADAGLEWSLYNWFCVNNPNKIPCPAPSQMAWNSGEMALSNGAKVVVSQLCFDINSAVIPCALNASSTTFKSVGTSGNSSRAFGLSF